MTKDIDRVVVESVENDARLEKGRKDLDEHDGFENDVDVAKKRGSAEARLAVDDEEHREDENVEHEHGRPNQHLQLLLHGQVHQHSVVAIANLDVALMGERKRMTLQRPSPPWGSSSKEAQSTDSPPR